MMKLRSLELSGFRGFLRPAQIRFGQDLTVITGRNGSGKSTICDAIEFVLTGTLSRYAQDTERRERIPDYFWWRGDAKAESLFASLTLEDDEGREFTVRREPDDSAGADGLAQEVRAGLVDEATAPLDAIEQLCLTTVVRDETINRLSTDLSETERFEFVKQAIGLVDTARVETKAKNLARKLTEFCKNRENAYRLERERVIEITSKLSAAKTRASEAGEFDLEEFCARLSGVLPDLPTNVVGIMSRINEGIVSTRSAIDRLTRLAASYLELEGQRATIGSPSFLKRRQESKTEMETLEQELQRTGNLFDELQAKLRIERDRSPIESSLAQLREHGRRIGLVDGHCPLCGSQIPLSAYGAHLQRIEERVSGFNQGLTALAKQEADLVNHLAEVRERLRAVTERHQKDAGLSAALESGLSALQHEAQSIGVQLSVSAIESKRTSPPERGCSSGRLPRSLGCLAFAGSSDRFGTRPCFRSESRG